MKREELSQLLRDKVLAGANGGHLSSDGVHILTKVNTVLLRLIPICVKPCGERMNLVCEGLSRIGAPALGVAAASSLSVSSSKSPGLPNFTLGSGMGRRCCTCSS